jgi:hypothetical protein
LATTTEAARPLEMPSATERGVVSHDVPSITFPSGSVILMGTRGLRARRAFWAAITSSYTAARSARKAGFSCGTKAPPRPRPAPSWRSPLSFVRRVFSRPLVSARRERRGRWNTAGRGKR